MTAAMDRSGEHGLLASLCMRGSEALADHRADAAISLYTEVLALVPGDVGALLNRSAAFALVGEHVRSIQDLEQALARDTKSVKVLYRLGKALSAAGKFDEAQGALQAARKLAPKQRSVLYALLDLEELRNAACVEPPQPEAENKSSAPSKSENQNADTCIWAYQVLEVSPPASGWKDIRKAYLKKAAAVHPDRGGDHTQFLQVHKAYMALSQRPHKQSGASIFEGSQDFLSESSEEEYFQWLFQAAQNAYNEGLKLLKTGSDLEEAEILLTATIRNLRWQQQVSNLDQETRQERLYAEKLFGGSVEKEAASNFASAVSNGSDSCISKLTGAQDDFHIGSEVESSSFQLLRDALLARECVRRQKGRPFCGAEDML